MCIRDRIITQLCSSIPKLNIVGEFSNAIEAIKYLNANEVLSLKKRLNQIYSKHTGKSEDEIKIALERDNFMTSENAKDFGLIDQVVEKRS